MLPEFKSKHLNIFCADANQWIDPEDIRPYMQKVDLEEIGKGRATGKGILTYVFDRLRNRY